jgi:hypothetical protein
MRCAVDGGEGGSVHALLDDLSLLFRVEHLFDQMDL